jgi:prevent-host-death family protein
MPVGIRELKNGLSRHLDRVRRGEKLAVTDRGRVIAYLIPSDETEEDEALIRLVKEDKAAWRGGKPAGSAEPARTTGKPISRIVIEDRR